MVKDAPKNSKQHTIYKLKDGTRVPGVTTILGILNKPALVPWANKLGLEGIKVGEYVDNLAGVGTLAHQMIADHLRKVKTDTSDYTAKQINQAENSLLSYFEWEKGREIKPILIEEAMVSEPYKYGGTIDCLAQIDGELTLLDFKTSKGIFPEMIIQLSAYEQLLFDNKYVVDKSRILRIGRDETEGFEDRVTTNLDKQWYLFKHCIAIYQLQKEIRKNE